MRQTVTLLALLAFELGVFAQNQPFEKDTRSVGHRSEIKTAPLAGEYIPGQEHANWMRTMSKVATYHHLSDSVKQIKAEKAAIKASSPVGIGQDNGGRAVTPTIGTSMNGHQMTYGTPSDNTIAISNGGKIVLADNDVIEYLNENGTIVSSVLHDNFFAAQGLFSSIFDPRVIYDPVADRFIYVILHGYSSNTSKIMLCFSKSNNPQDGWWIYELSGNPLSNSCWTDYPNIGISDGELFITGNLFTNAFSFNQTFIYQIGKSEGYTGQSLDYTVWNNILDGNNASSFTIVPASSGQEDYYGDNMYFVSARSGGSNRIFLYEITGDMNSNPSLDATTVIVPSYSPAADANQSGISDDLDNGDCRMHHAFYLNGIVHAVHHSDYQNSAYNGINYYRIPVNNVSQTQSSSYGQTGFDYSYPSVASFGLEECDQSVMIGCLRSGSSIFPEARVVNCDNDMQWSSTTQVFGGQSYVDVLNGDERWGDYSDIQRKHNATSPEVWMVGAYGTTSHRWRSRVAEIKGAYEPAPIPVVGFGADATEGETIFHVNFSDSTLNNPIAWEWHFEGGIPDVTTQQNPFVSYTDTGWFDVKLIATNAYCSDSLVIEDFIHVFTTQSDTDTVTVGAVTYYVIGGDTFQMWDGALVPLGVEDVPTETTAKVYPNPAQSFELVQAEIEVPSAAHIEARIYDIQGREVKLLFDDNLKPGIHRLSFNKLALPSGQYVLRITTDGNITHHEKIIVQH